MIFKTNKISNKLFKIFTCFICVPLLYCTRLEYYTPDLDLYIFRGNHDDPWKRGFQPAGVDNIVDYALMFFDNHEHSIHEYQEQNDMIFYASKIRVFLVSSLRGINTTYLSINPVDTAKSSAKCIDANGDPFLVDIGSVGIPKEDIHSCSLKEKKCYFGDLNTAGYRVKDIPNKKLFLTNKEGTDMSGDEVVVDRDRLRIFFSYKVNPCPGALGVASDIPNKASDLSSIRKVTLSLAISSLHNNGSPRENQIKNFKSTISHELGHYFGLQHSFERSDGIDLSCKYADRGTTDRIMDYTNTPRIFIPCEQEIYKKYSGYFLNSRKTKYKFDEDGNLIRPSKPDVEISSASYGSLSTSRQMMVDVGRVQIIDSSSEYKTSDIQGEPISSEIIHRMKPVF